MRSIRWCLAPLCKPQAASNIFLSGYPTRANHNTLLMLFVTPALGAEVSLIFTFLRRAKTEKKQSPDHKRSLSLTLLQIPLLLSSAKWGFPSYHSSLHNMKLIPENLPQIWFYSMDCDIIILFPKWRFIFAGNLLSLTYMDVIVWLSLPLTATKLK